MIDEELNIKVAQLLGCTFECFIHEGRERHQWFDKNKHSIGIDAMALPGYANDLNAMREAEGTLGLNRCDKFEFNLREIVGRDLLDISRRGEKVADLFFWHASARQRAEAFVRVFEK